MKKWIKQVEFGDLIKFDEHYHTIFNYDIDCSNMIGLVIDVNNPTKKDQRQSVTIKLKSRKYAKDLEDWENCLSFNFPDDDDNYGDLEVNLINKEVK